MSKCCILLSTYNGEKYLLDQLKSIYFQKTKHELLIFIRDDGSADNTLSILEDFKKDYTNCEIIVQKGNNIGVQKSFLKLIQTAPDADYYAFCDQDDYWNEYKIETAIQKMNSFMSDPVLYCSNYEIVDQNLNVIDKSHIIEKGVADSVTQILFQNRVPGCTMIFNKKLMDILKDIDISMVRMHDAYVLAVAYIFGKIIGDAQYQIKYRQHENNTVGVKNKFPGLKKWVKEKMELLRTGENYSMAQIASAILKKCDVQCDERQLRELQRIEQSEYSIKARLALFCSAATASKSNIRATLSIKCKILFKLM